MDLQCFAVHDKKAQAFITPFYLPNEMMASRTFMDCINDDSHQFSKHPEDYSLFLIGTFDMNSGEFVHELQIICNGTEVKSRS